MWHETGTMALLTVCLLVTIFMLDNSLLALVVRQRRNDATATINYSTGNISSWGLVSKTLIKNTSKFECSPVPVRILLVRLGAGYNERYMSVVRPEALRQERVLHNITATHVPSPSTDKSSSADMAARDDTREFSNHDKHRNVELAFAVSTDFRRTIGDESAALTEIMGGNHGGQQHRQHSGHFLHMDGSRSRRSSITKSQNKMLGRSRPSALASLQQKKRRRRRWSSSGRESGSNAAPPKCETLVQWQDIGHDHFPRYMRVGACDVSKPHCRKPYCQTRSFTIILLRRLTDSCPLPGISEHWTLEEYALPFCCDCLK